MIDAIAAHGRWVDPGLPNGQNYCYQLIARTATMVQAAGSDIVCAVARGDSTAPRGSITLNDGAPRSGSNVWAGTIQLDHEAPTGMQMRLALPDGGDSGWIPYQPVITVPAGNLTPPTVATIAVILRDPVGNESEQYVDDMEYVATSSVGAISGQLRVDTSLGDADGPIAGVNVIPDAPTEAGASTDASGAFALDNLTPGTYQLEFALPGYSTRFVANIVVSGGATQALGVVRLTPQPLFRDGFE